jgi:hypothetical protein
MVLQFFVCGHTTCFGLYGHLQVCKIFSFFYSRKNLLRCFCCMLFMQFLICVCSCCVFFNFYFHVCVFGFFLVVSCFLVEAVKTVWAPATLIEVCRRFLQSLSVISRTSWGEVMVHLARQTLVDLLHRPQVWKVERAAEWELLGETVGLAGNLRHCALSVSNPTWSD